MTPIFCVLIYLPGANAKDPCLHNSAGDSGRVDFWVQTGALFTNCVPCSPGHVCTHSHVSTAQMLHRMRIRSGEIHF